MRWGDVDLTGRRIRIRRSRVLRRDGPPKTGKSKRDVVTHGELAQVLRRHQPTHPAHDDFVFTTSTGAPIDEANFYRREWVPMLRGLGIRPRPFYNTRHTYISYLLAIGARPLFVCRQTGTSLRMIEEHYGQTNVLAEDGAQHRFCRKKRPRRTGAFFESGRPGSNRRRPAWEATKAAATKIAKSLIKPDVLSSYEAIGDSRNVPF